MRRALAFLALSAATLLAVSCGPAQRRAGLQGPEEPGTSHGAWPFAPESIRLSPLSRAVRTETGIRIEVLVECRDRDGDASRAIGMLWTAAGEGEGRVAVEGDLSSLDANTRLWDAVLRLYRLRIEVPSETCPSPAPIPVEAKLRLPDGRVLQDRGLVACP